MEASLELSDKDWLVGMQDMGAAGITCSCSEMSAKGKSGIKINLDKENLTQKNMIVEIRADEKRFVNQIKVKQKQTQEIDKQIEKIIDKGCSIVLWPEQVKEKDINDMILSGISKKEVQNIITQNTFSGASAKLRFVEWRKINA